MKDFDDHLEQADTTPDPEAKRKAIALARQQFEQNSASQPETTEKKSQGFAGHVRLMVTATFGRIAMVIENRFAWGGAATAGLLLVGAALLLPSYLSQELAKTPENVQDIQVEEVVVVGKPQPIHVMRHYKVEAEPAAMYAASPQVSMPSASHKVTVGKAYGRSLADRTAYELRHGKEADDRDQFEDIKRNNVKLTQEQPVSTFSIDVDTASYSFVRRTLNEGRLPPADAVRAEEMINYFDYRYPPAESAEQPFLPQIHVLDAPWAANKKLVHIGIKGYEGGSTVEPKTNLVFLLDVSGSMDEPDKLPLVVQSMEMLLERLKPEDQLSIVVYAGAAGAVLEPTEVKDKTTILRALRSLSAGGSTAGAAGIELAYQLAEQNFDEDAINRVILATDGDFNVGISDVDRLENYIKRKRDTGIYLSVLGFGRGNYNDQLMQTLAQNGNGIAAYIDNINEARKVLVDQASSSLFPIANDVKIQVEFNPNRVKEYRLIGYETRLLNREDFNNDKVDAGDVGAGHSVTALYEIVPQGSDAALIDPLRYQSASEPAQGDNSQEYGYFKLRYKLPGESESRKITASIVERSLTPVMEQEVYFSIAAAAFAQSLAGGDYLGAYSLDDVIELAQKNKGDDPFGYRSEFIQLVRSAKWAQDL